MVAIHSIFERGFDQDILELKELVKQDKELAMLVYECCKHSNVYAIPDLFKAMIEKIYMGGEMKVLFDKGSMGITSRSLKSFRNALCRRIDHKILIIKVPTSHYLCGFLIIDFDKDEMFFSGDGFRTDGGGEGSAGYATAKIILEALGNPKVLAGPDIDLENKALSDLPTSKAFDIVFNEYLGLLGEKEKLKTMGYVLSETQASYLRHYF
ncbi:MAG: hypothetical protein ACOC2M_01980 [bacterium]